MHCENEKEETVSDFEEDFTEDLHNLPHVLKFIHKLRNHIEEQRKKIVKLQQRLNKQSQISHCGIQTDPLDIDESMLQDWNIDNDNKFLNITDQVKQAAESALLQTGIVYEHNSGLYYDYNTGYYYDTRRGLYYDGNTGIYYYYDDINNTYQFHSQVHINNNSLHSPVLQNKEEHNIEITFKDDVQKQKCIINDENLKHKEFEEGECSESEDNCSSDEIIPDISTNTKNNNEEQDLAKNYPPCMRIIVQETNLTELKLGSLFLVTCIGGSLGREGNHSVLIPDINISKYHARFVYDKAERQYRIIDSGSRNGTFINNKRLSVAKQESEPYGITHGSIITVGETKLLCHIHDGNETCYHCEPGLVQQDINIYENKISKLKLYKKELQRLKYKFGIERDNVISNSQLASGYHDRAQARRRLIGSSNPYAKTQQSSIYTSITKENKGFKLLSKMGWSEGRSLGKDGDKRTEPLFIACNYNKIGLGSKRNDISNIELNSNAEKKQAIWRKAQKRYKEINELSS